uniref:Uncharacterized protein n=1 Tax=Lactuca sativa TaxID=4236 RepID=A0A9R1W4A4_LACSA|nr:hypothetical protein LSAT_V11C300139800 [Lactuca sativa]
MIILYARTEIFGEVLDTWVDLLNHQELGMDFGNSPYRLFLKVGVYTAYLTSTLSDDRKYEKFKENFHDSTDRYFKEINHPRENAILKESITPQRLEMPWRAVKNKADCRAKVLDLAEKCQKVEFKVCIAHPYKAMQTIQKRIYLSGISFTPHLMIMHLDQLKQVLVLSHEF